MSTLQGRVAIVTGAGRGLGREHALLFAELGAKVVVNDNGAAPGGSGEADQTPAEEVARLIRERGAAAVAMAGASGPRMLSGCWLQLRGDAPAERQIEVAGRYGLTLNLGGVPGECASFVSIVSAPAG